ncbi:flagellar motor switch protein FliM [Clostridium tetani]|uniref:Flagellar motor switch protein FliM n=1 Tax=Clostridium tetani (strain Massachusetts / E88) TaxID=212717 RepID=Q893T2_CLOTE|nr:flagellar motor switch protein FliM [Clostridium tetani]AAO36260.1 flagellar motor switch protein fliM [Clostridium tetani E88]KGI37777.1 flagellar motor switch protein FliM [Clostridium tetani]KGI39702.1 flagellar motor switch protein FliM [Clostridium tetani ATCC 9441]KGI45502.1 flagellar motor switch protein FliM [Clostridium tetani]KHO31797.1 flagellar motor switch protein FliM [Clostridium tetani]
MGEVLSQGEIDALLAAFSSGELSPDEIPKEEEKQKVKIYDFRSPQKFSKDHIRTLELIHDNYARIMSNYLTAHMRKNIKAKIESVQQITYEEFIHSIPNPTVLTVFKAPPLNGTVLFETNPKFVFEVMDVLLGGNAEGREYKLREFTDIDKNIIKQVNEGLIEGIKLAWEDILELYPEIESIETNPALNQTLAPNEPVALITFSVDMGKSSTFINICIPYLSIEKILDKLVIQYWFQENNEAVREESNKQLRDRINIVETELVAVLGGAKITVEEFLRLSLGDVLILDNQIDKPISINVENQLYAYGKPGVVDKNMGIQILDILDKDVENYE